MLPLSDAKPVDQGQAAGPGKVSATRKLGPSVSDNLGPIRNGCDFSSARPCSVGNLDSHHRRSSAWSRSHFNRPFGPLTRSGANRFSCPYCVAGIVIPQHDPHPQIRLFPPSILGIWRWHFCVGFPPRGAGPAINEMRKNTVSTLVAQR